ncbi:MAG: preprotein translocase subunit SecA [Elusimicrobia bacterium RIFCSPLOWO2_01_FULL_59_12]|nr:MAG: preprotein translocase subunit SecA [Elusimicrobia bacterium RIFCSPLOWO2_01_FULL_59_12]
MNFSFLSRIFGSQNERTLKRMAPWVQQINTHEPAIAALSDAALKDKTAEFRKRLAEGTPLENLLPEAFAVVREAAKRAIGLRHFDTQMLGGIALHQGKIAEMKTGEGKTLVATLPVYLNALPGRGVHVITVNDYLAKRDRQWMGPVYEFLGMTVGSVQHDMPPDEHRAAYACDITYVTNNEIGFDYLRDNMVVRNEDRVLRYLPSPVERDGIFRRLPFAIVDEVDSILVDEARTPLIISGPAEESTEKYAIVNRIVPHLKGRMITEKEEIEAKYTGEDLGKGYDYIADEKAHNVTLTDEGIAKCEKLLQIPSLYDDVQGEWVHHITQALRAHQLYRRDVDYVVKDGEVIIVDEFTGRLMPGRRWSEGLHQAVEAKENIRIAEENQTLATITFQNFFRLYEKLAGMTGTALTEAQEFWEIYKLDVVEIPTNRPMIRADHADVIYRTEREKYNAIVVEITDLWKQGRPVLVGTRSIEKSEKLAAMLRQKGVPHQVLNAKFHEMEAQIIAQAGAKATVTIATNMAGRGTDIVLGGNPPDAAQGDEIKKLGGLHVLGTERHESRRIDNQLRGRTGRQGDPGSSRFYLALDDELMRLFGTDRLSGMMAKLGMQEGEDIQHPFLTRAIENAQRKVEAMNFDIRKQLLEYDNVMNKQREMIYSLRNQILSGEDVSENIEGMVQETLEEKLDLWAPPKEIPERWDTAALHAWLTHTFNQDGGMTPEKLTKLSREELHETTQAIIRSALEAREKELGSDFFHHLERMVLLQMIDVAWKEHLYDLDQLKKGISLRAYAQKDPLIEFQKEAFSLFTQMMNRIREQTLEYLFKMHVGAGPEEAPEGKAPALLPVPRSVFAKARAVKPEFEGPVLGTAQTDEQEAPFGPSSGFEEEDVSPRPKPVTVPEKIGRNDPCPCGSGKKYKKCHGR